jgi:serine/threonine-protein kinase
MLGSDGQSKVSDLAVASSLAWDLLPLVERPDGAGYASPEQLTFGLVDGRADQFSLGLVLFEVLSGRACFEAESLRGKVRAIVSEEPPTLEAVGVALPAPIAKTLSTMLAKDPNDRFSSDDELLLAIAQCGAELGVTLKRATRSSGLV